MGIFNNKNERSIKKINPSVLEGFFNKINDIIFTTDYDGNIETINKPEMAEIYKTSADFFEKNQNEQLYNKMINHLMIEGNFIEDIEIMQNNKKVRMYVAAYNVQANKKMFFYIKDANQYLMKEMQLLKEIDKQEELLKSKDLFIANLSHEIKTPINIIVGMIYFLKDTQLDEKQLEYVNKLDEASKLLLGMISDILNLSKDKQYSTVSQLSDFNMKKFLDNMVESFSEKAKAQDLQIYTNFDFDPDTNVHADATKLGHIFMNLLDNAIKYTNKGFIELSVKKVEENNICYKMQFCLKDTGIGIKKEDTINIFKAFSQAEDPTKKTIDGKGMGLAIVKKYIEEMNGKIWVESSVGLGSKFYFYIVLDKCTNSINTNTEFQGSTPLPSAKPKKSSPHEQKRILLVEDNELNIEITKKLIEDCNYICDVAEDGIKAISQIQKVGIDYYDLVLMDIHLPKYNGYEISKILKQDLELEIPIVALTATNVTDSIVEQNANYIKEYILKPISPADFKEKLNSYLQQPISVNTQNQKKTNVLLFASNDTELKKRLSESFNVVSANDESELEILLQTGTIETILIDEMEDLDNEFQIINKIKCTPLFSNLPIVLINRNENSDLKQRAYELSLNGIIEKNELAQCQIALYNIIKKLEEKNNLKELANKSKEEIEDVYNFLFESLVNLTSMKSKETGAHLKRTKEYMRVMLAKYEDFYNENLFKDKETIEEIAMAAVLHDIGKIGIPDNILNKPGKLTDEEYEIMKSHVTIGRELLESTYGNKLSNNILNYAKDITFHHHEKYDGTGYPEHLKQEEISVISRNMALIDVYDALVNKRIYKPAMPYEEVEEYITNESGKAFDPKVVNIFLQVKDKLKAINEENQDNNE